MKESKLEPNVYYLRPTLYHRPLRPYEKAYMYWYIEMLKPPYERDQTILDAKYAFARDVPKPPPPSPTATPRTSSNALKPHSRPHPYPQSCPRPLTLSSHRKGIRDYEQSYPR